MWHGARPGRMPDPIQPPGATVIEETFLRLQHSEGLVAGMASRLLAAYIGAGQVNPANEDEMIEKALSLAIRLARLADRTIESDDENSGS